MQRDNTTLIDIYNMISLILDFTQNMTKKEFLEDVKTQAAVLYEIALLGNAHPTYSKINQGILFYIEDSLKMCP